MPRISKYEALARLIEERMTDNLAIIKFEEIPLITSVPAKDTPRDTVRKAAAIKYGKKFRTKVVNEEVRVSKI